MPPLGTEAHWAELRRRQTKPQPQPPQRGVTLTRPLTVWSSPGGARQPLIRPQHACLVAPCGRPAQYDYHFRSFDHHQQQFHRSKTTHNARPSNFGLALHPPTATAPNSASIALRNVFQTSQGACSAVVGIDAAALVLLARASAPPPSGCGCAAAAAGAPKKSSRLPGHPGLN